MKVDRPIDTPIGVGNLEKIYMTDTGLIMFKVWHEERNMFLNWSLQKLLEWNGRI
jgi:hypothetical protein